MAKKDIRTKRTTETLTGIKYIKMSGLESKFLNIVRNFYFIENPHQKKDWKGQRERALRLG